MKRYLTWRRVIFVCFLLFLCFLPRLVSEYNLNLATTMLIYSLLAVGFNIIFGQAGLLSFGHSAFFGIGAYTAILVYKNLGLSLLPGILAGALSGVLLGIIFGLFLARLKGLPFALLSLAFNALIYAGAEKWRWLTHGEDGLAVSRPDLSIPGLGNIDMLSTINFYYFVLAVVGLCIGYCWFFNRTPLGRVNVYIRENPERATFVGHDIYRAKFLVYLICALFCSIAGALFSTYQEFVSTTFIHMEKSLDIVIMTFVGGRHAFWGPILGASSLVYGNDALSSLTSHWAIIQGALFIALIMYAPEGMSGLILRLRNVILMRFKSGTG